MNLPVQALRTAVAAIVLVAWTTPLFAFAGEEGQKIAIRWCSSCHVVTEGQTKASADVPTFAEIKRKHNGKMDFLEAFLSQSHPQMPNMNLTYREIRNLVAYFESL